MGISKLGNNLRILRKDRGISQAELGLQVNKGQTTIGNWENNISQPNLDELIIVSNYLGVTIDDLIKNDVRIVHLKENGAQNTGNQNVNLKVNPLVHLKPKNQLPVDYSNLFIQEHAIVHDLDSKAAAGSPALLQDEDKLRDLPKLYIPGLGTGLHFRIKITGDSMEGTVKNGDRVVCTQLPEPASMLREGAVYIVLDKDDGIVCKRVYKTTDPDYWSLESDNVVFKPYKRHLNDILQVFKVVEVHSTHLHNYNYASRTEITRLWDKIEEISNKLPSNPS
jgi:transcriptional regulator with XRE-family HTH domain